MSNTTDMTKGSAFWHILKFSLPLILTNLGQQFYMIVDAAIVGRGVGVSALAAVGATDWINWMFLWGVTGFTQGFATFVSRFFGEKNWNALQKTIHACVVLCAVIGVSLTLIGVLCARPLLTLLKTPADIFPAATTYLITMISGMLIVIGYNMVASILRAFGDGKTPLIAMIIAALMNIALDCLFVFVFKLGIFGAALASIISQAFSFVYCFIKITKIEYIHLGKTDGKIDWKLSKDMLFFSTPLATEYMVISLGGIILQSSVNAEGSIFLAGYTATNKLYSLLESSSISIGYAVCTFLSQNYGAGNYPRVKTGVKIGSLLVCGMAVVVGCVSLLLRQPMLSMFLNVNEAGGAEAMQIGVRYLTMLAVCLVVLYLIHVFRNALQAIEISVWSMISGFGECAVRVFMAKVIYGKFMGGDALLLAEPLAWAIALILVIFPYFYYSKKLLADRRSI